MQCGHGYNVFHRWYIAKHDMSSLVIQENNNFYNMTIQNVQKEQKY